MDHSVAASAAGIRESLARLRNKLPVIAFGMQSELQHSESVGVSRFTIGSGSSESAVGILSAGAHHKLANSALRLRTSFRILRGKALVAVIVSVDYDSRLR